MIILFKKRSWSVLKSGSTTPFKFRRLLILCDLLTFGFQIHIFPCQKIITYSYTSIFVTFLLIKAAFFGTHTEQKRPQHVMVISLCLSPHCGIILLPNVPQPNSVKSWSLPASDSTKDMVLKKKNKQLYMQGDRTKLNAT